MSSATTLTTPQDQVEVLIQQIAEENGLEMIDQLQDLNPATGSISSTTAAADSTREDELARRSVNFSNSIFLSSDNLLYVYFYFFCKVKLE